MVEQSNGYINRKKIALWLLIPTLILFIIYALLIWWDTFDEIINRQEDISARPDFSSKPVQKVL
jgi:uncharacterized membrane protein YqiK